MSSWHCFLEKGEEIEHEHPRTRGFRYLGRILAVVVLLGLTVGLAVPARFVLAEGPTRDYDTRSQEAIEDELARMSVEERVGQLFVVPIWGSDVGPTSDAAELIGDYRVGGIVLMPDNMNHRNDITTSEHVRWLSRQLQALAYQSGAEQKRVKDSRSAVIGSIEGVTTSVTATETRTIAQDWFVPLLVAAEYEGDGYPNTSIAGGLTPVPSNMALGATWQPEAVSMMGQVAGRELRAMGINVVLGPVLDVVSAPRPSLKGDLGTRSMGGSAPWVGRLGRAYIEGLHQGAQGHLLTVAKHYPGLGAADRQPDEEIPTVPKSLEELRNSELIPFMEVTAVDGVTGTSGFATPADPNSPLTDALMSGHIRYRSFQGNIRQLTRPISLDPQNLGTLLSEPEFAHWREQGGLLMTDDLGVPAVRQHYDPQLQSFPYKRIAQDAFLAGNDLLLLAHFGLTDRWTENVENIKATIEFFQEKYVADRNFQARVDQSVRRILAAKYRLYGGGNYAAFTGNLSGDVGDVVKDNARVFQVAKEAVTLLYPAVDELPERLPSTPSYDDDIVIFTDSDARTDCRSCPSESSTIPVDALEKAMVALYGPKGSGQIDPGKVRSLSFAQLKGFLLAPPGAQMGSAAEVGMVIDNAEWLIFAMLDANSDEALSSDALKMFLGSRSDGLRGKKTVVLAFGAPYYLDTTEISKLTAYYGVYSKVTPFLEAAVRAVFQEFTPSGASPVTVEGVNYDLALQTSPSPDQIIEIRADTLFSEADLAEQSLAVSSPMTLTTPGTPMSVQVGSTLRLETGVIVDRNGHPVPDGTSVVFELLYPREAIELPRRLALTMNGAAATKFALERTGQLQISASSGSATRSNPLVLNVQGEASASLAALTPSLPVTGTLAMTSTTSPGAMSGETPAAAGAGTPAIETPSTAPAGGWPRVAPRVRYTDLWLTLCCIVTLNIVGDILRLRKGWTRVYRLRLSLMGLLFGVLGYLIYALGIMGTWSLWRLYGHWGAVLFGACLSVIPLTTVLIARGMRATR